jgi:hypothetical protein
MRRGIAIDTHKQEVFLLESGDESKNAYFGRADPLVQRLLSYFANVNNQEKVYKTARRRCRVAVVTSKPPESSGATSKRYAARLLMSLKDRRTVLPGSICVLALVKTEVSLCN